MKVLVMWVLITDMLTRVLSCVAWVSIRITSSDDPSSVSFLLVKSDFLPSWSDVVPPSSCRMTRFFFLKMWGPKPAGGRNIHARLGTKAEIYPPSLSNDSIFFLKTTLDYCHRHPALELGVS